MVEWWRGDSDEAGFRIASGVADALTTGPRHPERGLASRVSSFALMAHRPGSDCVGDLCMVHEPILRRGKGHDAVIRAIFGGSLWSTASEIPWTCHREKEG